MSIVKLAFDMAEAVQVFVLKAKKFFYNVMLFGYRCPKCNDSLMMVAEGRCKCNLCQYEFDPTIEFQKCPNCGSIAVLRVRRYQCENCGSDIRSKFLFEGLVFDTEYFKGKMAESRQRKKEQRERIRQMLAESRSSTLTLEAVDFDSVPGLWDTLNSLTMGLAESFEVESGNEFNLKQYEEHIQAHVQDFPLSLREIPQLNENTRKDLIWRFIAAIFLAHYGIVDLLQDGQDILVIKHEANREGQGVFGESEETDGIEGSVGRVEAW
jgi:ribosomal protein S27AE